MGTAHKYDVTTFWIRYVIVDQQECADRRLRVGQELVVREPSRTVQLSWRGRATSLYGPSGHTRRRPIRLPCRTSLPRTPRCRRGTRCSRYGLVGTRSAPTRLAPHRVGTGSTRSRPMRSSPRRRRNSMRPSFRTTSTISDAGRSRRIVSVTIAVFKRYGSRSVRLLSVTTAPASDENDTDVQNPTPLRMQKRLHFDVHNVRVCPRTLASTSVLPSG